MPRGPSLASPSPSSSSSSSSPPPPATHLEIEPDDQWKVDLRKRVDLLHMVEDAQMVRDTIVNSQPNEIGRERAQREYDKSMENIRTLAQDMFARQLRQDMSERKRALQVDVVDSNSLDVTQQLPKLLDHISKADEQCTFFVPPDGPLSAERVSPASPATGLIPIPTHSQFSRSTGSTSSGAGYHVASLNSDQYRSASRDAPAGTQNKVKLNREMDTIKSETEARIREAVASRKEAEAERKEAEALTSEAESHTREAEAHTREATTKKCEAEAQAREAEAQTREAETRTREAETRIREAEARISEAEAQIGEEVAETGAQACQSLEAERTGEHVRQLVVETKMCDMAAPQKEIVAGCEALLEERTRQALAEAERLQASALQAEASAKVHEAAAQQKEAEARSTEAEARKFEAKAQDREANVRLHEEEVIKKEEKVRHLE